MTPGRSVAVITGGARGIGRAIAVRFSQKGLASCVVDLAGQEETARETVKAIREAGGEASFFAADVAQAGQIETVVKEVSDKYGGIDILVNNAGITRDGLILRMKEENWDAVLTVNLKSAFLFSKAVCRSMMKRGGGRIINISSVVGLMGNAGQANYAASKAGLIGLTKSLAKELAGKKITVNAVAPGFIVTQMTDALPEEQKARLKEQIPLGGLGSPEDVSAAVAFLASPDAAYITGQVLAVDGGMSM